MNSDRLEEIRQRVEAATTGDNENPPGQKTGAMMTMWRHAPEDITYLMNRVEKLERALNKTPHDRTVVADAVGRKRLARALDVVLDQDIEAVWHEIERKVGHLLPEETNND